MEHKKPHGELTLRTLAMPADTNANGDIFGGWLVSQMDLGASIISKQRAKCRTATIAIDKMVFKKPVQIGETISVYCDLVRVGRTSMTINVQVWSENNITDQGMHQVTEGVFTFVAIDDQGKPQAVARE